MRPRLLGPAMYHPALDDATVRLGCEPLAQTGGRYQKDSWSDGRDLSKRQELGETGGTQG